MAWFNVRSRFHYLFSCFQIKRQIGTRYLWNTCNKITQQYMQSLFNMKFLHAHKINLNVCHIKDCFITVGHTKVTLPWNEPFWKKRFYFRTFTYLITAVNWTLPQFTYTKFWVFGMDRIEKMGDFCQFFTIEDYFDTNKNSELFSTKKKESREEKNEKKYWIIQLKLKMCYSFCHIFV